jgi:hypothetical protein
MDRFMVFRLARVCRVSCVRERASQAIFDRLGWEIASSCVGDARSVRLIRESSLPKYVSAEVSDARSDCGHRRRLKELYGSMEISTALSTIFSPCEMMTTQDGCSKCARAA